ncbi:MAG TPA: hypothetical protein VM344_03605 [Vitreimonas sp.]|nr:hypothetical protein [Vitreimonas sp.]
MTDSPDTAPIEGQLPEPADPAAKSQPAEGGREEAEADVAPDATRAEDVPPAVEGG